MSTDQGIEFVKYFPSWVGLSNFEATPTVLGTNHLYRLDKVGADVRLVWSLIESLDEDGSEYSVDLLEDAPFEAFTDERYVYCGVVFHGRMERRDSSHPSDLWDAPFVDEKDDDALQETYRLIQRALRCYNDLVDAARTADADSHTLAHPCLHEPYQLGRFRSLRNLTEPTRRARLGDFVDSSMFHLKNGNWIRTALLVSETRSVFPADVRVQEVTQALLNRRRTAWANYLVDAVEYVLDGELGSAIIAANIALELGTKELVQALTSARAAAPRENKMRRLLQDVGFGSQLEALLPLLLDDFSVSEEVMHSVHQLHAARNDLLHWGMRSGNVATILGWIDAARQVCVTLEEHMIELGVEPALLQAPTDSRGHGHD